MENSKRYEVDLVNGNILINMVKFCIPLILTGILQLLYNAADMLVVANFSGDSDAVGAVGSTGSLISLIVNLFMGLSVGTNVLSARNFTSNNAEGMKKVVHTAVLSSLIIGTIIGIFGCFTNDFLLNLMKNPLELSRVYLRIYFIGLPFNMLYNFASAILRGVGDTKRPLIFLSISGVINVFLNLIFVIVCKMSVEGVALATIISQAVSCVLIIVSLMNESNIYKFSFKNLKISKNEFLSMLKIGLPAGIQNSVFSISNVIIQSSVNAFGATVIDGNSSAQSLEGFVYTSMNSVYHASLTFASANYEAKNFKKIISVVTSGLIIVTVIGVVMGGSFFIFGKELLSLYAKTEGQLEVGYIRLHYLCLPYFLCGIMDVMCGVIRGLGYAILPMIVSLVGVCGFRIVWIYTIFRANTSFTDINDLNLLYISYPISWIITFFVHFLCYLYVYKKIAKTKVVDIM